MQVDLKNRTVEIRGDRSEMANMATRGLMANGAAMLPASSPSHLPDILIVAMPLLPDEGIDIAALLAGARSTGAQMTTRGSGRILFILSAIASVPMRRYPNYSSQMAMAVAEVRALAMRSGPSVLVNALGVGAIGTPVSAGDAAMLSHAPVKRSGTLEDVVNALLFFCDPQNSYVSGQTLAIDGGWSVGYARNF